MKAQIASAMTTRTGAKDMKYILLMSGTRAGVEAYHALPKQDINAHMAVLHRINQDLAESGEFVATQGLTEPKEARVVRGRTAFQSPTVFSPNRRNFCWATGSLKWPTPSGLMPSRDGFPQHP
jgi:hypothetical protein